jgi:NAD(P)-dependent dehydrogenase (short-subunit alcohol dehydrogenase family)
MTLISEVLRHLLTQSPEPGPGTVQADVRDETQLKQAFQRGVAEIGPVDIVLANAGIAPMGVTELHSAWQDVIDANLTGVFNTVETAIPSMKERGTGGAIVLTSSTAGINGIGGPTRGGLGYTAAKHGVVGLMRSYANTVAPFSSSRSTSPTRSSGWSPTTPATSPASPCRSTPASPTRSRSSRPERSSTRTR